MSDTRSERAADYVLGLTPAAERAALARAAASDPALERELSDWSNRLAPLAGVAEVAPPADMLARIEAAIAGRSQLLSGTITLRASDGEWEMLAPGVERKMLWAKGPNGRVTFLVRMAAGARFASHAHDDDEECYVISGDLTFDELTLRGGDYHLAPRGVPHPVATSAAGCLVLITAAAA